MKALEAIARVRRSRVVVLVGLGLDGDHDALVADPVDPGAITRPTPCWRWAPTPIRRGSAAPCSSAPTATSTRASSPPETFLDGDPSRGRARDGARGPTGEAVGLIADGIERRRELDVRLTEREREVLTVAAEGLTAREIATRLGVRERTVTTHLGRIYGKLGVGSRLAAVRLAARSGLVTVGVAGVGLRPRTNNAPSSSSYTSASPDRLFNVGSRSQSASATIACTFQRSRTSFQSAPGEPDLAVVVPDVFRHDLDPRIDEHRDVGECELEPGSPRLMHQCAGAGRQAVPCGFRQIPGVPHPGTGRRWSLATRVRARATPATRTPMIAVSGDRRRWPRVRSVGRLGRPPRPRVEAGLRARRASPCPTTRWRVARTARAGRTARG